MIVGPNGRRSTVGRGLPIRVPAAVGAVPVAPAPPAAVPDAAALRVAEAVVLPESAAAGAV
ncbi:hypothetical protein [Actinoplanes derwentensis]|uniref:hypothetical protein n=1 Tax=Actinoplanes derwentensis TaxID=113562 RepID=UPI000B849D00|nr:hypothetical protein [Actinoplanes derwentensis]